MKKTIVLYPGLAVSHFVPMMQLTDALLEEGYAVTVALIDPSLKGDIALAAVVDRVASSKPSVTFHKLPRILDPPAIVHDAKFLVRYSDLVNRHNQHLHDFLCSMPPCSVHALIVDFMSVDVLDGTKKLGIPTYSFFSVNASTFAIFSQFPSILADGQPSMRELGDTPINLHGVPPMPASHIGVEMLEDPESRKVMLGQWERSGTNGVSPRCLRFSVSGHWSRRPAWQRKSTSASHGWTSNRSAAWCTSASEA